MEITFQIGRQVLFGQTICICGSLPELGAWNEDKAVPMKNVDAADWKLTVKTNESNDLSYYYLIKENNTVLAKEWGKPRQIRLNASFVFYLQDFWRENPLQRYLYTSAFSDGFSESKIHHKQLQYYKASIVLKVRCPYTIEKDQEVIMLGESDLLGNWQTEKALPLKQVSYAEWVVVLNAEQVKRPLEYKFAIYDKKSKAITHWDEGFNKTLYPLAKDKQDATIVQVISFDYQHSLLNWKTAGVAIPVFSLRTKKSFGIGEFSDLKKMVDWAKITGMKMIQILPINDTTITETWLDSYPYNAISIYALHPIYLGLHEFPLENAERMKEYLHKAAGLNELQAIDYEQVFKLKMAYIKELYKERGKKALQSEDCRKFIEKNEEWLFPYACFVYFRGVYHTANYSSWKLHNQYNKEELTKLLDKNKSMKECVSLMYFTQYLLHIQLLQVKEYAHKNGIVLKGDIPIGISHDSVEAWTEPQLFNMDTQTGAPPDDFSALGQNWGFPTYNWDEMAKDGYQWWKKRFRKMADYFDAYRIDHILGFFRIWEIPLHSVQGLLGYFSPALPFTVEELRDRGIVMDEERMLKPYIPKNYLSVLFGEYAQEVIKKYLQPTEKENLYELKESCNTQQKIKALFKGPPSEKNDRLREGLYSLCNEVLFIRDKHEPSKYHPRIMGYISNSFNELSPNERHDFYNLYVEFFYQRHNQFWGEQAMKKLPALISSTDMLVCGEDLGMIPYCVPQVMSELQILRLDIQRMPKDVNHKFENLNYIPYLSVCTTSTHDMAPIRGWWRENKQVTQLYYNDILWKQGPAPDDCTPGLCWQILVNHLNSPAMLVIIPLQDWLSMDENLRRKNPEEERINDPGISPHYWQYRMHLNLEDLLKAGDFNKKLYQMLQDSNR